MATMSGTLNGGGKVLEYRPQIDALRAFAVLMVLLHHFLPNADSLGGFLHLGWYGVRLFFVISGYLITSILLREKQLIAEGSWGVASAARRFYIRRCLRIFPIFYLVLLVTAWADFPLVRQSFGWHLGYLSNFWVARNGWQGPHHFWSLAVEEQFYLLWPWLILCIPLRWLKFSCLAGITGAVLYRLVVLKSGGWLWGTVMMPGCLDSLALGGLLALLRMEAGWADPQAITRWTKYAAIIGGVVFVGIQISIRTGPVLWDIPGIFEDTALALLFVWMVDRCAGAYNLGKGVPGMMGRLLSFPPLLYVGRISYGIYLIHLFVPEIFRRVGDKMDLAPLPEGWGSCLIYTAGSIGLASISWWGFERPINNLKRYFPYRPKKKAAEPTGVCV